MKNTGAERLRDVERQFAGGDDEARSSSSKTSFNGAPPTPDPMKSRKPKRTERSPKRDQPKKKQKKPTSYDLSHSFFFLQWIYFVSYISAVFITLKMITSEL